MRTHTFFLCTLLATSGCTSEEPLAVGTLDVALTATGGGGAIYRLPPGSRLAIFNTVYAESFSLDGETAIVSINVPAGDYSATLLHPAGYTTTWPLERQAGATVDTVQGTLLTVMPVGFNVPEGFSVGLTLTFEVADGGVITFGHGTIDVTLAVGETVATGGAVELGALMTVAGAFVSPDAPAALAPRLPATGDSFDAVVLARVPVTGWRQVAATTACAAIAVDAIGSGDQGFLELLAESTTGGDRQLCVDSLGAYMRLTRSGAPTQPRFTDLGTAFHFETILGVVLPSPAFDGQTLDLGVLTGSSSGAAFASQLLADATGVFSQWYGSSLTGTATLVFTPMTTP